jgi:hypothetical protein
MWVQLTEAELHTTLAALRTYQRNGYPLNFATPIEILEIASCDNTIEPLGNEGIDLLCEELNIGTSFTDEEMIFTLEAARLAIQDETVNDWLGTAIDLSADELLGLQKKIHDYMSHPEPA